METSTFQHFQAATIYQYRPPQADEGAASQSDGVIDPARSSTTLTNNPSPFGRVFCGRALHRQAHLQKDLEPPCPGGAPEISPAIYRWECDTNTNQSPVGTIDGMSFIRPYGTDQRKPVIDPAINRWAKLTLSLRDAAHAVKNILTRRRISGGTLAPKGRKYVAHGASRGTTIAPTRASPGGTTLQSHAHRSSKSIR